MSSDTAFREYVAGNLEHLRRTAYLLCGDWHTADDLTSTALAKLYRHWRRASQFEHLDAYVRRMLLRAWLDERRRPWRREHATDELPERSAPAGNVEDRDALLRLLAQLPPRGPRPAVLLRPHR